MGMLADTGPEQWRNVGSYPHDPQLAGYRPQTGITAYWMKVRIKKKQTKKVRALAQRLAHPLGEIRDKSTNYFLSPDYAKYLREAGWSEQDLQKGQPKERTEEVLFYIEVPVSKMKEFRLLLKSHVVQIRRHHFSRVEDVPGAYVPAEAM